MELKQLEDQIINFIKERDWEQFHSPKNLAIAIGAETGELLECFQWKTDAELEYIILGVHGATKEKDKIADEIADLFAYIVSLSRSMEIDLEKAILDKLEKNNKKYPVEKSKGNAKKYTEL